MKRSFDLNGSSMSSGYWGAKPVKKKTASNPDTIDETTESIPKSQKKLIGSSRSDENTGYKHHRSIERKKMPIHSSKSDENDYAKSHLVKEKELQDRSRRNLVFTENIFNLPHKQNEIKPFLIDTTDPFKVGYSKPPINPKKTPSEANNQSVLLNPAKLFEKPLDIPTIPKVIPSESKNGNSKPNEIIHKSNNLTYRVEDPIINAKQPPATNTNDANKPSKKPSDRLNEPKINVCNICFIS